MSFLVWHYTKGLNFFLNRWLFVLTWVNHYFSIGLLIKSLFAPWKRLIIEESDSPGLKGFFDRFTFNLISRAIGAVVRLAVVLAASLILVLTVIAGFLLFLIWLIFPPLGLRPFWQEKGQSLSFAKELFNKIKRNPGFASRILWENRAGVFIFAHVGLNKEEMISNTNLNLEFLKSAPPSSYQALVEGLIKPTDEFENFLNARGLLKEDIFLAAYWWDAQQKPPGSLDGKLFGRPGIGLELLFGYTPSLNNYVVDLSAPRPFSHHLIGREPVVFRMERILSSNKSVFLTGQPGVGKYTVALEFAYRAGTGQLGKEMSYRRVLEFDYNFLLSETTDLSLKKKKLSLILDEAARAGNIILVIRDLHRLTNSDVEGIDFTDVFEPFLEQGQLKIIAIVSQVDYERFLAPNLKLRKNFQPVEVIPPTKDEAMIILLLAAYQWEKTKRTVITIPSLRRILDGTDRYITDIPFPEKALELLDEVVFSLEKESQKTATPAKVDQILSEKVGLPLLSPADSEKKRLNNLEEIIHRRLIDQEKAVSLIAKSLRSRIVGVRGENRPVGSFLFMGPTGVGKTQTARALASAYYGSEKEILRFDLAEYASDEGIMRLLGSLSQNQPGVLAPSIRNRPASLLLLDEIEKAPPKIYNLFLTLLDEGYFTDAFGRKINCRNLFVIATSNAGAEKVRQLVSQGLSGEELQKEVVDYVQREGFFQPEFLNRFDGVVVFEPLRGEDLIKIAYLQMEDLQRSLKQKNIYLEISEDVCRKLAQDGYQPEYGARPMKRMIDLVLGDLISRAILNNEITSGDNIKIVAKEGVEEFAWEKIDKPPVRSS
ncbi:MAG: AAA family ATPase [Patescibacteria group bacterium]|nr:AAA family ATPase [Patescibacteria group bacterium]